MATVHRFLPTADEFYDYLQRRAEFAERCRLRRFRAVLVIQRRVRGYLVRKHVAWLATNATIIQCAFRKHVARKVYKRLLELAVKSKHEKYYAENVAMIQALWRGHCSRRKIFCYRSYRRWLATVKERGERRAAEAAEFGIRSRADDLLILEAEAKRWLAYVFYKLHHLLRTTICAGVYSDPDSSELSDFEKLLKSIRYTDYMKRLRDKYREFVKRHQPEFSNKRLFPVIGDGKAYWYLSLVQMYELTSPHVAEKKNTRHSDTHHGSQHKQPFLWKKVKSPKYEMGIGPFRSKNGDTLLRDLTPPPDPRFYLYVQYYTPKAELFDYVDFHINALLTRKQSILEQYHQNVARKC